MIYGLEKKVLFHLNYRKWRWICMKIDKTNDSNILLSNTYPQRSEREKKHVEIDRFQENKIETFIRHVYMHQ